MVPDNQNPNHEPSPQSKAIRSARRRAQALNGPGASSPAKPLEPGGTIGGCFRLDRQVGEGGMGVVWLAWDEILEEAVALKFLPGQVARDPEAVDELRREAKAMRGLTHPGIVRLHDIRFSEGHAFLVQAYMVGGSLADFLASVPDGTLSLEETMWALREIAPALNHAHTEGITHRDIKPANLLLSKNPGDYLGGGGESLRVADFGLAFTAREAASRTSGYRPSGTLAFMAPEILMGKRPTPAADVYSLAATAYCLLTGRPPFDRGDIATQAVHAEAPRLNSGRPSLDGAVAAALAKDPEDRPETVEQFMAYAEGNERLPRGLTRSKRANVIMGLSLAAGVLAIAGYFTKDRWMGGSQEVLADPGKMEEPVANASSTPKPEEAAAHVAKAPDQPTSEIVDQPASSTDTVQRAPSDAELAAKEAEALLSTHIARIDGAANLSEVDEALKEALQAGLRNECESLCGAMAPRLQNILSDPPRSLEAALVRLAGLESIYHRSDCERTGNWSDLSQLALPVGPFKEAVAGMEFGPLLELRNQTLTHVADDHECMLEPELASLAALSTDSLGAQLDGLVTTGDSKFVELLQLMESSEVSLPEETLASAYAGLAAFGASADKAGELDALRVLGSYMEGRDDIRPEAHEAIGRIARSLLEASIESAKAESKNDRVKHLFVGLNEVENSLKGSGQPDLGDLQPFADRVGAEFTTNPNVDDLIRSSYEFLGEHQSSALNAGVLIMLENALAKLKKRLPKENVAGYNQRYFEDVFKVVQKACDLESGFEFLELGKEGNPPSALLESKQMVLPRIDRVFRESKKKRVDGRRGKYALAAKELRDMERALAKYEAMRDEYVAVLPVSAEAQMDAGMFDTHEYRNNEKMFTKVTSTRSLEDASKSSEAWLAAAQSGAGDRAYQKDAFDTVIQSYFYQAEVNYLYVKRVYKPKVAKNGKYVNPPARQKKAALKLLAVAEDYYTQFKRADSGGAAASNWIGRISAMESHLKSMVNQD